MSLCFDSSFSTISPVKASYKLIALSTDSSDKVRKSLEFSSVVIVELEKNWESSGLTGVWNIETGILRYYFSEISFFITCYGIGDQQIQIF